jgi:hypothetical protein
METAETYSAVSLRLQNPNLANDYLEYLGEYKAICKTVLARESGGPWGLFDEKTPQNLVTLSL